MRNSYRGLAIKPFVEEHDDLSSKGYHRNVPVLLLEQLVVNNAYESPDDSRVLSVHVFIKNTTKNVSSLISPMTVLDLRFDEIKKRTIRRYAAFSLPENARMCASFQVLIKSLVEYAQTSSPGSALGWTPCPLHFPTTTR